MTRILRQIALLCFFALCFALTVRAVPAMAADHYTFAADGFSALIIVLLAIAVYFAPAAVASSRQHSNATPIFVINLFLGWTFLGWVIALAWAFSEKNSSISTQKHITPIANMPKPAPSTMIKNKNYTALHRAAYKGDADTIVAKVKEGADVNAKTDYQSTPLHLAAQNGHLLAVNALITGGADVCAKDAKGNTPMDWALQRGYMDIIDSLKKAGGYFGKDIPLD